MTPDAHCPICGEKVSLLDRKMDPDEQVVRCAVCVAEAIAGGPRGEVEWRGSATLPRV